MGTLHDGGSVPGMYVTLDAQTKMAYIGFNPQKRGIVAESVDLSDYADDAGVETLHDLILDFDKRGRLVGIEVMNAERALPESLIYEARKI
jgi:uncharacterized protein YuzE